jgi:hypothetical protein
MIINNQKLSNILNPVFWTVLQVLLAYILLNMVIRTHGLWFNSSWNFQDIFTLVLFTYELAFGIVILNLFFAFTKFRRQSIEGLVAVFLVLLWFIYEFGVDITYTPFKIALYMGITVFSLLWPILWERHNQ